MREEETYPIEEESDLPRPFDRVQMIGHTEARRDIGAAIQNDSLAGGWIIAGGDGIGKATLAAQIAKAYLCPEAVTDWENLYTDHAQKEIGWVQSYAHPDLIYLRRKWDKKKKDFNKNIAVDDIREMIGLCHTTAGNTHGRKMIIVDKAEDLNKNSANAFLKLLEEPPAKTVILVLTDQIGRLLPTISSRCKKLILNPVSEAQITPFLQAEAANLGVDLPQDLSALLSLAEGRPGYALKLCAADGLSALALCDQFFHALMDPKSGADLIKLGTTINGKNAGPLWQSFQLIFLQRLSMLALSGYRAQNLSMIEQRVYPSRQGHEWADIWRQSKNLLQHGAVINSDKTQLIMGLRDIYLKA